MIKSIIYTVCELIRRYCISQTVAGYKYKRTVANRYYAVQNFNHQLQVTFHVSEALEHQKVAICW